MNQYRHFMWGGKSYWVPSVKVIKETCLLFVIPSQRSLRFNDWFLTNKIYLHELHRLNFPPPKRYRPSLWKQRVFIDYQEFLQRVSWLVRYKGFKITYRRILKSIFIQYFTTNDKFTKNSSNVQATTFQSGLELVLTLTCYYYVTIGRSKSETSKHEKAIIYKNLLKALAN